VTLLELETRQGDGLVQVILRGELDLSTIDKVEEELRRIDDQVEKFLDSTGLRLMVTADAQAQKAGRRLVIVKGPEAVHRVFTITKLDEKLEMVGDISELP
jgi:anti-anti-sigma factor